MPTVATHDEIVQTFLRIPLDHLIQDNWGTGSYSLGTTNHWNVTNETYINGVILTIDMDYYMGYLIEAVDRTNSTLTYAAIVTFHGADNPANQKHDSFFWAESAGTFFNRDVSQEEIAVWGVNHIYALVDSYQEAQKAGS